jgi:TetR/AcrR family transcriptional regulator, transcriptional repressor for nem operon
MARPKEFDRDNALQCAIALFREKGYAGTSTEELLRTMNIGRQSMYDTFGDKRGLYLAALRRYNDDSVGDFARDMTACPSPLGGLEAALMAFASRAGKNHEGCMGVNAVFEWGRVDPDVTSLTDISGLAQLAVIERRLRDARAAGEVTRDFDEKAAARFVAATLAGIKVAARSGADLKSLEDIIRFAMRALKAPSA